ncbi:LysR family transcriptional regulator [Marinomonas piezotolerans]|uniref:LysR family transcriptional regulator n=1 Tax=Marinomonas piezotolerans TaxID=2213058 RepID=A0A370U8R8_9GAMM|nr:LysR family transcriptional regulator [Marinomonas piezotolerans]RDL44171.1 LysR family transcriptional regulator [Marinomonas piezotolerans]
MATPSLDDLFLFIDLVDAGSYSDVAKQRGVTRSSISKHITKLEAELGVQLLFRTTRQLAPTEAGRTLYQKAQELRVMANATLDSVSHLSDQISGHIRLSVPTISGELLLADAVSEFCQAHPDVTIDMTLENQLVDLVAGHYDLVIRTAQLEDSSLKAAPIFDSRWLICASPDYLAQYGHPDSPQALLNHHCLGYSNQSTGAFEWLFKTPDGNHYTQTVAGSFSSNNAAALKIAALKGRGIAYLPMCLVYDEIQDGRLQELLEHDSAKILGIYALYPFTKAPSKRIRALIDFIKVHYERIQYRF